MKKLFYFLTLTTACAVISTALISRGYGKNILIELKETIEVAGGWDRYIYGWAKHDVPSTERWVAIRTPFKKDKNDMGNFWDVRGKGKEVEGPGKPLILWELEYKFQRWPERDHRYRFYPLEQFTGLARDKGYYLIRSATGYYARDIDNRVELNYHQVLYEHYSYHWRIINKGKNRFLIQCRLNDNYITAKGKASKNGAELITVSTPNDNSYWEFIIIAKTDERKTTLEMIGKRSRETAALAQKELQRLQKTMKKGARFKIGDTSVITRAIKDITGFFDIKPYSPDDVWKKEPSNLPDSIKRDPSMRAFNWRDAGMMTPVKFQEACGSCWAFGSAGVYEAVYKIKHGTELDISEQHVVDCLRTPQRDCGSCGGGSDYSVFQALQKESAVPEAMLPYEGKEMPCERISEKFPYKVKKFGFVNAGTNITTIKELLCKFGPLGGYVKATDLFKAYKSGVYDEHPTLKNLSDVNHVIVIVGWDDDRKAFLIKNSWSEGWGEEGYMWIEYGSNNVGTGATWIKIE
ncbi:MAG: hypothetical protein CVV44_18915 [Spirochaetae bacterium HGW-Spirochaetae-1]|jgi:C1A family cysteine protease|nr:MAG: hypothetical protein CVV44_18915 [Spirochaetae bacterium HGW-Spirochaetae-1]